MNRLQPQVHHHPHTGHHHGHPHQMGYNKDDIYNWFRTLNNWNRIDLMCGLLDLCHPFEVRYLGTFLEELGSKDYTALKTYEEKANSIENKQEIGSLGENPDRSRLTIYLTLLRSKNSSVAAVFYDILGDYMQNFIETGQIRQHNHSVAIQEYMLLLILAVSHPAFSIEQKEKLRHLFDTIQDEVNLSPQNYPPVIPEPPPVYTSGPNSTGHRGEIHRPRNTDLIDKCQTTQVVLKSLETQVSTCGKMLGDGMDDELVLDIGITWSDKRENSVKRTLNEVSILERDMRHELLGMKKREKVDELEKYFNGFKGYSVREYGRNPPQEVYDSIVGFIECLGTLPEDILNEMFMRRFLGRMDSRMEMRGSGLDTESRSPTPQDREDTKDEVYWWLHFHKLQEYHSYFRGYTLNQLFLFGESEWTKEQFRDCPPWAKKRMQELFKHVRANRPKQPDEDQEYDPDDSEADDNYDSHRDNPKRKPHSRSPQGLSHSESAPSNIGRQGTRPRVPEVATDDSDESRSTNQNQDSRPGSSRGNKRDQRNMHDRPGVHPQQYNKVQQQMNKQFNHPPMPQAMGLHTGMQLPNHSSWHHAQAVANAQAQAAQARERERQNMDNNEMPMPAAGFPPFAHITHQNGIPLMPPPIMSLPGHTLPQSQIQSHPYYQQILQARNGGQNMMDQNMIAQQMQQLNIVQHNQEAQLRIHQNFFQNPPPQQPGQMPNQIMNNPPAYPFPPSPHGQHPQQQQQNHQHPQQQQQQQQQQHQQKKAKQRTNNSCYNCGGQGHQAEQCPEQENQKNPGGGDNSFGLNYGPNPNQNPLDRVGGEGPPTRKVTDDPKTDQQKPTQQQRKQ